jgi:hypothetical protein
MQHFSLFDYASLLGGITRVSAVMEVVATRLNADRCARNQKKRQQQCRRRNSHAEKPLGFSKKKQPYPSKPGAAANTEQIESFVYCSLI